MAEQMASIAAVLGLLAALLWWLRRKGFARAPALGSASRRLKRIERLALTPQHSLHLIALDGRAILLAVSPAGVAVVGETGSRAPAGAVEEAVAR